MCADDQEQIICNACGGNKSVCVCDNFVARPVSKYMAKRYPEEITHVSWIANLRDADLSDIVQIMRQAQIPGAQVGLVKVPNAPEGHVAATWVGPVYLIAAHIEKLIKKGSA